MCYSLVFACTRLEHYILPRETEVVSKVDLIRLILHRPTMQGRLMKWTIRLAPFELRHRPIKAVKGQVMADLLTEFTNNKPVVNKMVLYIGTSPWKMFFDGSRSKGKSRVGVILEGPRTHKISLQLQMEEMTHNSAEYEALILGLEALIAKGAQSVVICGDSQLVINQQSIGSVDTVTDWRTEIMIYLESPSSTTPVGVRLRALYFQLIEGVLYKRTFEGILLRCLGPEESIKVMEEVHCGICGAHRAGLHMRWAIHRMGFYWPRIFDDCIRFAKGCQECQRHGPLNHLPIVKLHAMVKPWPFKAWALDVIGKIHPASSKQHSFILVATDYFTKWVEAVPLKNATQKEVIEFILNHIICRFGIPHTLTTDQGLMFIGEKFIEFLAEFNIKLYYSSPYYPQANGLAEAANKIVIGIIRKW
ncbi:uncharacterized protein LOC127260404 [Andrographis paniculata]|uniref:uncharacterized protein LOC127260404 n=1 Tax=Andrographis paniculata TaxID=175694 RepID=UPI0021E8BD34|nr:uncharacterized protein LOC127260404 [Andrographis paniculata]